MPKPKLVLYSHQLPDCPCFQNIFNTVFEVKPTGSEEEFLRIVRKVDTDAAVVCFCSTHERDAEKILQLDALTGPVPVLTCSTALDPEFVALAAKNGADRFLCCSVKKQQIQEVIFETMRRNHLQEFLQFCYPGSVNTPHIRKMIQGIVHSFPHRLNEEQMATRIKISRSYLKKMCRQAFGKPFTQVMRRIWIYQALHMMRYTDLDNTEIALQLNYSEESNMARDFRKELSCSPSEARRQLLQLSPADILLSN